MIKENSGSWPSKDQSLHRPPVEKLEYFYCDEIMHGVCWVDVVQPEILVDWQTTGGFVEVECRSTPISASE